MIDRRTATARCRAAKAASGLSFARLAEAVGAHPTWVASVIEGQNPMTADQATALAGLLGLDDDTVAALQVVPMRGSLPPGPITDPLIARFQEIVTSYGTTLKAVIEEEFGDGIMSAIDFRMDVQRKPDPAGDRVVVTLDGKFLPFRVW
ncbi:MAG: cyanase [Frankiales bacterium]|nr:cyanase [Frankiales bacterium]